MFDPPHLGHVILAAEARWQLGLDELRMVVSARPPHRDEGWLPVETRLALVERAVSDLPGLVASRLEMDRPGEGYTVDTLAGIRDAEPDASLWLVIGADQMIDFATWREPARIVSLARLAVVAREGADLQVAESVAGDLAPGQVDWIRMPTVAISSRMIRRRIGEGEPVEHLLPSGVGEILVSGGFVDPTSRDTLKEPSRTT